MALILNATAGDPNANSYCTLAEARAFYAQNVYAIDDKISDDLALTAALVDATQLLDDHYDWFGTAASLTQALLWPRNGVFDAKGAYIPSTAIPDRVKKATAEMARQLLLSDRTADNDVETQGIKRLKADTIELEFRDNTGPKVIPDRVADMLLRYGRQNAAGGFARTYRV